MAQAVQGSVVPFAVFQQARVTYEPCERSIQTLQLVAITETKQLGGTHSVNVVSNDIAQMSNNVSSLDKGLKDRCVLVGMNAAKDIQYLPIARKVAADLNVVLNETEPTAEIAATNGSMREVMSRIKRPAHRKQSASTP